MSNAPYQVDVFFTDDETVEINVPFDNTGDMADLFDLYTVEYSIKDQLVLTEADGITINAVTGIVTFTVEEGVLDVGVYQHGCRLRETSTDKTFMVFDGSVNVTEGNFS